MKQYNPMLNGYEYTEEPTKADWVLDALKASEIDPLQEAVKPQVLFQIADQVATSMEWRRVFTLGNFSAIIGKAKAKKTYLLSAISASIISRSIMWQKFRGLEQPDKSMVLYFDTEQGDWDSWNVVNRIFRMGGLKSRENFKAFNLRRYSAKERREIIEFALMMHGDEAGFVVIDGIADLVKSINDEEDANSVTTDLMRWTQDYNCHIATVIHQNKADNYATGHIGSYVTKKCEIIIAVQKDELNPYTSYVECVMSRGVDFMKFKIAIEDGLPVIDDNVIEINDKQINADCPF